MSANRGIQVHIGTVWHSEDGKRCSSGFLPKQRKESLAPLLVVQTAQRNDVDQDGPSLEDGSDSLAATTLAVVARRESIVTERHTLSGVETLGLLQQSGQGQDRAGTVCSDNADEEDETSRTLFQL